MYLECKIGFKDTENIITLISNFIKLVNTIFLSTYQVHPCLTPFWSKKDLKWVPTVLSPSKVPRRDLHWLLWRWSIHPEVGFQTAETLWTQPRGHYLQPATVWAGSPSDPGGGRTNNMILNDGGEDIVLYCIVLYCNVV